MTGKSVNVFLGVFVVLLGVSSCTTPVEPAGTTPTPTATPTITITSPANGAWVSVSNVTVQGTSVVAAPDLVTNIQVQLNGGGWQNAAGTTTWSLGLILPGGTNTIYAKVFANNGKTNVSPMWTIVYSRTNALSANTNLIYSVTNVANFSKNLSNFVVTNIQSTNNIEQVVEIIFTLTTTNTNTVNLFSRSVTTNFTALLPLFSVDASQSIPGVKYSALVLGDINGNNCLDLIMTGCTNMTSLSIGRVYTNDGTGLLVWDNNAHITNVYNGDLDLCDMDMDGDLDLFLTGYNNTPYNARIYDNDGNGVFTRDTGQSIVSVWYSSAAFGDLNGDTYPDLVHTGINGASPYTIIYTNDGSGVFKSFITSLPPVRYSSVALGDINLDNHLDLVLTGYTTGNLPISKVYTNDGMGNMVEYSSQTLPNVAWSKASLSDFNQDGSLDLVLMGHNGTIPITIAYTNNGEGLFVQSQVLDPVMSGAATLGDLNKDGYPDLVLVGDSGGSTAFGKIYLNDGTGVFVEYTGMSIVAARDSSAVLGDLDKDGDLDLIITGRDTAGNPLAVVYKNNY